MEALKTKAGRTLFVKQKERSHLFFLEWDSGGKIPEKLKGLFTSAKLAKKIANDFYREDKRVEKDG